MNWMTPILFSIGWLNVRTVDICLLIGLFFGLFVYWRKVKYDSEYNEAEAFDGFLISLLVGWLAGRVGYILLNFDFFGLNPANWLNVLAYPGLNIMIAMIVSGWYLYGWAKRHKFDAFRLLDFWATAASLSLAFYHLGFFLSGLGFGYETDWIIGIMPPGMMTKMQPVELYWAVFYILIFIYLVRVEYKYRYYEWYKNGRSAAENGFLVAMFMILSGGVGLLMLLVGAGTMVVAGIDLEWLAQAAILVWGLGMLWLKSGRKIGGRRKTTRVVKNEEEAEEAEEKTKEREEKKMVVEREKSKSQQMKPRRIEMEKVAERTVARRIKEVAKATPKVTEKIKPILKKAVVKSVTVEREKEIVELDAKKNALRKIDLKGISKPLPPEPKKKKAKTSKTTKKEIRRFKLN